jgi:hypothetical protein
MARYWPRRRIAHLGYLVGIGCTGPQIAAALSMANLQAISNACQRYELKLQRRGDGRFVEAIPISRKSLAVIDEAAALRGIDRVQMLQRIVEVFGHAEDVEDDLDLITNLLDDGGGL